jgi:predicted transposase/invertase (TIGR01784 family)
MDENKRRIHQPDDNFFKKVMQNKENAKAYLTEFYPGLAKHLNLEEIELRSESFLTPKFSAFKSDIIYRCPFKDSEEHIYLSLIWEHKLNPDKWVAIQLGLYIFLSLNKMVKEEGKKVEPIIPLLFYNGKDKWEPKTIHQLFKTFKHYNQIKRFLPNFDFLFKNITGTSIEKLIKIKTAFFRSAMVAMANRHNLDLIHKQFSIIFDIEDDYHFEIIATYILGIIERSPKEIQETFNNLDLSISKDKIMSTLEMLLKEGEEIGIKKGEEIGIKKGKTKERAFLSLTTLLKVIQKFPNWRKEEIAHFTEIKTDLIEALLNALAKKNKKNIQKVIDSKFLPNINLSKSEKAKVNKLVTAILKRKDK